MIKRLCVNNFYSFKEGMDISFQFDGKVPYSVKGEYDFSTVLGIKGANGSGKTNIIKAIAFLNDFCGFSYKWDKDEDIPLFPFFNSEKSTQFLVEFSANDVSYIYELEVLKNSVLSEIVRKVGKRKVKILERKGNEVVFASSNLSELKSIKLKQNSSIIGVIHSYNFESEMEDLASISKFFYQMITNVNDAGLQEVDPEIEGVAKIYFEDEALLNFVSNIIVSADSGISRVFIDEYKTPDGEQHYMPVFVHENGGVEKFLTIWDESSGTKSLFKRMHYYALVLKSGGILALDEFDIHLHAMILPKVIDLFLNRDINPLGAQFIFTAHNTELIDSLGQYRTVLVNKEDNESYCYRLDEIPGSMIRNDRPISPLYLQGKLGGVPNER